MVDSKIDGEGDEQMEMVVDGELKWEGEKRKEGWREGYQSTVLLQENWDAK